MRVRWAAPGLILCGCVVLGAASHAQQTLPIARVVLTLDKPAFLLGEQVNLSYCLENTSATPVTIDVGGDYRGATRSQRFKVAVTDTTGADMPDPDPGGYSLGGISSSYTVASAGRWCQSLPLMRYARIDRPGTYAVRVTHDLGWPRGQAPQGQTSVTFSMPTAQDASRIIATTTDFSTLRYPIFLAPLVQLANDGSRAAVIGIGAIPTPDATRALISLLTHADRTLARDASQTLAMRLPDPALDGGLGPRSPFSDDLRDPRRYLRDAGWRVEFAADVRAAAQTLLASMDVQDVVQGAFMIEAVGDASDGPAVSRALTPALERTLTLPLETGVYPRPRGAMQELMRAAEVVVARGYVPSESSTAGELALWVVAFGHNARPTGWEDRLGQILAHRLPYLRELALSRLPANAPPSLFATVDAALRSTDMDLQIAACGAVSRARLASFHEAVAAIVRTAKDFQLLNFARNTLVDIGGRLEMLDIMRMRLTEPGAWQDSLGSAFLGSLVNLLDGVTGHSGGPLSAPEAEALASRWRTFLATNATTIASNRRVSLDDVSVTPDLVPRGWILHRAGKPDWPPR